MKPIFPVLACLSMIFACGAHAEEETRWYDVEVLVFENKLVPDQDSEAWPVEIGIPALDDAIELAPAGVAMPVFVVPTPFANDSTAATDRPLPYQQLETTEMRLTAQARRLGTSADHRLILHKAWRQPVLQREISQPVHLGDEALDPARDTGSADAPTLTFEPALDPAVPRPDSAAPSELQGTIQVSRNRYLHIDVDLLFSPETEPQDGGGFFTLFQEQRNRPDGYRLTQSRRVRSGELHYIDHPRFGVLALISGYDLPEPTGSTTLTDEAETVEDE